MIEFLALRVGQRHVVVREAVVYPLLEQSVYGKGLDKFAALSRATTFAPGEGLPGRVMQSAQPIVFGNIQVGPFIRHRAADEAGLEVGVGIPIHDGETVRAVVLLLI